MDKAVLELGRQSVTGSKGRKSLIEMRDVAKIFAEKGVETKALSGVDLNIEQGEYVAICGPSGCGKSTLLSLIGLLDVPSQGHYLLQGDSVIGLPQKARAQLRNAQIGFVFQNFNLIGSMTVADNVALPLLYRGISPGIRDEMVAAALERVGLTDRAQFFPNQLSGGQQQRASVARACVTKPALLLADEPTGNLDSQNGLEIMNLLNQLHEDGTTICLVTHDPRYVDFAGRRISLLDGVIVNDRPAGN